MTELTALVSAIATLLVVLAAIGGGVALLVGLKRHPEWRAALLAYVSKGKLSVGPVGFTPGSEAPPSLAAGSDAPVALLTEGSTAASPAEATVKAEKEADWFSLLEKGQFAEALCLVREEAARQDQPDKRNRTLATGYFLAFFKGHHEAADLLRVFVETNPAFSEGHDVYAMVLSELGKTQEAESEFRQALAKATTEERTAEASRRYAEHLVQWKRVADAIEFLKAAEDYSVCPAAIAPVRRTRGVLSRRIPGLVK